MISDCGTQADYVLNDTAPLKAGGIPYPISLTSYAVRVLQINSSGLSSTAVIEVMKSGASIGTGTVTAGGWSKLFDNGKLCLALNWFDVSSENPANFYITLRAWWSALLKAFEFGPFWAENAADQLKPFAQAALTTMQGAALTGDPVIFQDGKAYVVFKAPDRSGVYESSAISSIRSVFTALMAWVKNNPGTFIKLTAFSGALALLAAIAVKIVDWQTKVVEYKDDVDTAKQDQIDQVLQDVRDGKLTTEEAAALIEQILKVGTDDNKGLIDAAFKIALLLGGVMVATTFMKDR